MKVSRNSFKMIKEVDIDADLSYLGEYSSSPGPSDRTIDRKAKGDMERNTYQYFIAANSGKETGNRLSVGQDYKRMEGYNKGDWCMVYVRAEVVLQVPVSHSPSSTIRQTISSGGLYGIESDSESSYFDEVYQEQCEELAQILTIMGITVTK